MNGPVYEAIAPVKTVSRLTDANGRFIFMYISHETGVKYTITVSKHGFETQTVSGSSPPAAYHAIRLRKTATSNADKTSRLFP